MDSQTEARRLSGALVMRGLAAIIFGIAAVFWPGITLVTIVYLFGAFVLVNGLINTVLGIGHIERRNVSLPLRLLTILLGLLELGVGVYLLRHPSVTFVTMILLISFILIIRGAFEIVGGLFESGSATMRTFMVLGGSLAVLAGVLLLFQPETSGVAFVWLLGLYALIVGPLSIAMALDLNKVAASTPARGRR